MLDTTIGADVLNISTQSTSVIRVHEIKTYHGNDAHPRYARVAADHSEANESNERLQIQFENSSLREWQPLEMLSWRGRCRSRRTWGRSAERRTWTLVPARCNRPWTTTTWGVGSTVSFLCKKKKGLCPGVPSGRFSMALSARPRARPRVEPPVHHQASRYYDCPHVTPTARGPRMYLRLTQTTAPNSPRILRLVPLSDHCLHRRTPPRV